jgi:peptidyl-prolyl cis-trans isomerase B (cyclophilin B)
VIDTTGSLTTLRCVRRALVPILILLATSALVACGKEDPLDDATATTTAPPAATATTPAIQPRTANDGCEAVAPAQPLANPNRRLSRKKLNPKRNHTIVLKTNCGTIRILLAVLRAPKTTASVAGLVRNGFFDGLSFHRIAKPGGNDYVIQGGDPLGTGNGGPGYTVVEAPSKRTRYVRGVVAMAKAGDEPPGASGSQFFIVTAESTPLAPDYAILGRVTAGNQVVRRIARLATDPGTEMPIDPVVIEKAMLESRG